MAFWKRSLSGLRLDLLLEEGSVCARPPVLQDFEAWAALREDSRAFLTPWEPTWGEDELSRTTFRRRLRRYAQTMEDDTAYPFFVFRLSDMALVGGCTLSNVRRGAASSAMLGYWVGEPYQRQGYTIAAVRALLRFALGELHLHRIEAACLPDNQSSRNLLEKAGFREEGLAREYLKINGAWCDHVRYAFVKGDPLG